MSAATIPALLAKGADGETLLRAPKVGIWTAVPRNGALLAGGSSAGRLTQVGHRFELVVPDGVSGRVATSERLELATEVAYGDLLFRILPVGLEAADGNAVTKATAELATDGLKVLAPTDGVFYRSPGRGAAAYVLAGDRVVAGQPIGLIEVMKTFNPIAYGGAGLPDEAEIVEILVADEAEVRVGQALVIVKRR